MLDTPGQQPLELAVTEYAKLKLNLGLMEAKAKELKAIIENHLVEKPNMKEQIAGYQCTLSFCESVTFRTKEALEVIQKELLEPFIKRSQYTMLRVTYKGGKPEPLPRA